MERKEKRLSKKAESVIRSGDRVYIHPGCAVPQILVDAMVARYEELYDVEVCHLLGVGEASVEIEVSAPGTPAHGQAEAKRTGRLVA